MYDLRGLVGPPPGNWRDNIESEDDEYNICLIADSLIDTSENTLSYYNRSWNIAQKIHCCSKYSSTPVHTHLQHLKPDEKNDDVKS